jgi:hypothetical protein
LVAEGEFFGQTAPAAAILVLRKMGRPNALKTEQLVRALRKGGVPVKDAGTLYRSMNRNVKLKRAGKGLWGLSEWYGITKPRTTARTSGDGFADGSEPESEERPEETS